MNYQYEVVQVHARIAPAIIDFAREVGGEWHMDRLRNYVAGKIGNVAPASPDRVLRQLRQDGKVQYHCVNRRQSLYRWGQP